MTRQTTILAILAAVAVTALFWLFLYSPGREEIQRLDDDIVAAQDEGAQLGLRIQQLEAIRREAPEIETLIANLRGIVPASPDVAAALRQISAAAEDSGVIIDALSPTRPAELEGASGDLHVITVAINVSGSYFQTVDFLRRLEEPEITARGLRLANISLAPVDYPTLTVAITGIMFAELPPVPDPQAPAPEPEAETDTTATDGEES